ncbi:MAG: hypothetical protein M0027_04925 [Candidatus Dormibacteraeota bacterium]|nr:hypothetical protein [Candidatus Dormibacteraeota bacterium]
MPEVIVSFLDGETLYGEVPTLHLDDPFLEVELHSLDGNTRQALVPASAVRQVEVRQVEPIEVGRDVKEMPRVALHFADGQVFRAHVVNPASLQRFGAVWDVIEAGHDEHRVMAIPYTAMKAAFYVRHWDTRRPVDRDSSAEETEGRRLAEIQARRSRAALESRVSRSSGLRARMGITDDGGSRRRGEGAAEEQD